MASLKYQNKKKTDICKIANGSPFYRIFIYFFLFFAFDAISLSIFLNGIFFADKFQSREHKRDTHKKLNVQRDIYANFIWFFLHFIDLLLLSSCFLFSFSFGQLVSVVFIVHRYSVRALYL